jgi:hypothetical protein
MSSESLRKISFRILSDLALLVTVGVYVANEEACQSLLLKMRDKRVAKFDIHKRAMAHRMIRELLRPSSVDHRRLTAALAGRWALADYEQVPGCEASMRAQQIIGSGRVVKEEHWPDDFSPKNIRASALQMLRNFYKKDGAEWVPLPNIPKPVPFAIRVVDSAGKRRSSRLIDKIFSANAAERRNACAGASLRKNG